MLYFCSVNTDFNKKEIIKKIWEGKPLTPEEEKYYLVDVVELSEEKADAVITINSNTDPLVLID